MWGNAFGVRAADGGCVALAGRCGVNRAIHGPLCCRGGPFLVLPVVQLETDLPGQLAHRRVGVGRRHLPGLAGGVLGAGHHGGPNFLI